MGAPPTTVPSSGLSQAVVAAEQRARQFLAEGKWRKARDEIKPLVKTDRARYLPLLIQANLGLANEMVAKGLVSEARQVLDYLATLAPAEQLRSLELEIAGKSNASASSLGKFTALLADPNANLPENDRLRLADQVVLAFQPVPGNIAGGAPFAAEVQAVHDGLLAVSLQQWERVAEVLRAVPHRSLFSHWAAFIKGLAAFHTGETDKARRFFAHLPPGSVPAKGSQSYLLLTGQRPTEPLAEPILDGACRLAGLAGAGRVLLRADRLWREGNHSESYRVFRESVPQFPSEGLDWLSSVADFYFSAWHGMPAAERRHYLQYFDSLLANRAAKNGLEEMLILRLFSLSEGPRSSSFGLREDWEGFIQLHERLHKPNPRWASLACTWLGEQLAAPIPSPFFVSERPRLRDAKGATDSLNKAIALDPNNLQAWLQLCSVYTAMNDTSARNRLLDDMTKRFPDEKAVLLEAAAGCLLRKAYLKGLDYLERARQLDRLDPKIADAMLVGRRRLARQYYQQKRLDKGRQTLAQNDPFLVEDPADLQRSRWANQLRQGLMEVLWGDAAQGDALLAQARPRSPFPAAFFLFAHLANRTYQPEAHAVWRFFAELKSALKQPPNAAHGAVLARIFLYWSNSPEAPPLHSEQRLLQGYLKAASRQMFTRQEAIEIVLLNGTDGPFAREAVAFVKRILAQDRKDPKFRLYEFYLQPTWGEVPGSNIRRLQSILDEARRRHDHTTAQEAQQALKSLERPPPPPPMEPEFEPEEEDVPFPLPPDMSPEGMEEISGIMAMLANASESELRKLLKHPPKGVPKFMLEAIVAATKAGQMPPLPPGPKPRSIPIHPNQSELF